MYFKSLGNAAKPNGSCTPFVILGTPDQCIMARDAVSLQGKAISTAVSPLYAPIFGGRAKQLLIACAHTSGDWTWTTRMRIENTGANWPLTSHAT